jgi:hypothetical protein
MRERHHPRLCLSCAGPMGRQEDTCWHCGAPVRRSHSPRAPGPHRRQTTTRRPLQSMALSRLARRRQVERLAESKRRASALLLAPRALRGAASAPTAPLRRGSPTRRVVAVPPRRDPQPEAVPSRAEDHARWQRERAEARARTKRGTRELAAAIDVAEASYRRLRHRLDDYGASLEAVRVRLCGTRTVRPAG